jgi:peptide/nickel transport system substrate-binding protein
MNGPGPYEFTVGTIGEPETVDPAKSYDTASSELIWNVYETLIFFDGENMDSFIPVLATEMPTYDAETYTFTFTLREGVPWHDPAYGFVTPEDVEYSIERSMVEDYSWSPAWMIYEPLLGAYVADMEDPDWMTKIDNSVTTSGNTVSFHCVGPYAPMVFYQVWGQAWASVLCKQWCIDQGCWDGVHTQESLIAYHAPDRAEPNVSPLDSPETKMMGSGPYKFEEWVKGSGGYWTVVKNDDYWQGWPAYNPYLSADCRGYVTRMTSLYVEEWATRKLMFLAGDLDMAYVPRMYMDDVWAQPGIDCVYPLPSLVAVAFFWNHNISLASRYLREPWSVELAPGELDEGGIPPNFFSDADVRKAFCYSVDYVEFLDLGFQGEAIYPATPAIVGLPYRRPDEWYAENAYFYDLAKAEDHFRNAWGGQLWETGFTLTLLPNEGNVPRETICELMELGVESLNPKFHVEVVPLPWGEVLLPEYKRGELPSYMVGWLADYPDPHNWFQPFMHTYGGYAGPASYSNPYADELIEAGIAETDDEARRAIYYELQQIYVEDCPGIMAYQPTGRHWEQQWMNGWYYNPCGPGAIGQFAYYLWKEDLPIEDVNSSGEVDIFDIVHMAKGFGSYYAVGDVHPNWDSKVDLNLDKVVDIFDVVTIAKVFGFEAPPWTPPA